MRTPRCLEDIPRWKATEFKAFLFYVAPVVFMGILPSDAYKLFICLSYSIRLLSTDAITKFQVQTARKCLEYFNLNIVPVCGARAQVYNVHSLRHLADQVKCFGPLWTTSAFGFESANHHLKLPLTGTVNQAELIIQRYNVKQDVMSTSLKDDRLKLFTSRLFDSRAVMDTLSLTQVTDAVRQKIVRFEILSREQCSEVHGRFRSKQVLLHSKSYKRRRDDNDSIVQFKCGGQFVYGVAHVFVKNRGQMLALISPFTVESAITVQISENITIPQDIFIRRTAINADLWINTDDISAKCCILNGSATQFIISPVIEKIEHN